MSRHAIQVKEETLSLIAHLHGSTPVIDNTPTYFVFDIGDIPAARGHFVSEEHLLSQYDFIDRIIVLSIE